MYTRYLCLYAIFQKMLLLLCFISPKMISISRSRVPPSLEKDESIGMMYRLYRWDWWWCKCYYLWFRLWMKASPFIRLMPELITFPRRQSHAAKGYGFDWLNELFHYISIFLLPFLSFPWLYTIYYFITDWNSQIAQDGVWLPLR